MKMSINALDPSQEQVLNSLIKAEDSTSSNISVVYGPPGTGKSHLIVSLLFELAIRKKKVLFVSQNTEALNVIYRMIKKLEKEEFNLDGNNLSFLDFCIMLNRTEQRRLKYIKNQRDRLFLKEICPKKLPGHSSIDLSDVHYDLSYGHLGDRSANENLDNDAPVGMDELLFYYLHNVKNKNLLGSPIKNLDNIKIREIFKELQESEKKLTRFAENNHPTDALRFVSKNNFRLQLSDVRGAVDDVSKSLKEVPDEIATKFVAKEKMEIFDFVDLISEIPVYNDVIDLYEIQKQDIDLDDFVECLALCDENYTDLEDVIKLDLPSNLKKEIFVPYTKLGVLKNADCVADIIAKSREIREAIAEIGEAGVSLDQTFANLVNSSLRKSKITLLSLFKTFPGIKEFDAAKIEQLFNDVDAWNAQKPIVRKFKAPKGLIAELRSDMKDRDVEDLIKYKKTLESALCVIRDTQINLGQLSALIVRTEEKTSLVDPLRGSDPEKVLSISNRLLYINSVSYFLEDNLSELSLAEIDRLAKFIIDDVEAFNAVVDRNMKQVEHSTAVGLIEQINCNIRNNKKMEIIDATTKKIVRFLRFAGETPQKTDIEKAANIVYDSEVLGNILNKINIPTSVPEFNDDMLELLKKSLISVRERSIFNDNFYTINVDDNIEKWCNRIKTLSTYASLDDFDNFIEQNRIIYSIGELLGRDNAENLNEFLKNDSVTFDDFREKITVDFVKATYQSLSAAERARISKNYFKTYRDELSRERKNYFLDGLAMLKLAYEDPAKVLKTESNWVSARSTMEKIRKNSRMIFDAFPIVVATPKEVSKYIKANKAMFDYVIFDEASQLLPGQALPSIYRAQKAIIIGDPHQMPPTLSTDFAFSNFSSNGSSSDEDLENDISILDLAIEKADAEHQHHLKVHYRSKYNILFEPSRLAIYEEDGIRPITEAKGSDTPPIDIKDNLGQNDENNMPEIARCIIKRYNDDPNSIICLLFTRKDCLAMFQKYIANNSTANQVIGDLMESNRLLISTVTNCQGIEGEHVVIYFNYYQNPSNMWFFNEKAGAYKRLNVAITRQRESLDILMANPKSTWLTACQHHIDADSGPNAVRSAKLMQHLLGNAGQEIDEEYLEKTFGPNIDKIDSPLTQELYNKLCAHYAQRLGRDLKIWCEVGWNMLIPDAEAISNHKKHVGYRLDIGIYSTRKKRFVLGIEMDGAMYHSGAKKEFADQQRQAVLEMKGWTVYRIWSTNWLNNTHDEFASLVNEIDRLLDEDDFVDEVDIEDEMQNIDDAPVNLDSHLVDGVLNRSELVHYLRRHELDGIPIEIKYQKSGQSENELEFSKMYIESLTDNYIIASFDGDGQKTYKYNISSIVDFR